MVHHIVWQSRGGLTEPENLVTLCGRCHALVHENLLEITGKMPDQLEIRDRKGESTDRVVVDSETRIRFRNSGRGAIVPSDEGDEFLSSG